MLTEAAFFFVYLKFQEQKEMYPPLKSLLGSQSSILSFFSYSRREPSSISSFKHNLYNIIKIAEMLKINNCTMKFKEIQCHRHGN